MMKNLESKGKHKHLKLGKELYDKKKFSEAIKEFDKFIKKNPNVEIGYYFKAFALAESKQYEKSILYYDKSLELNPSHAECMRAKSLSLMNLGKYEESIQICYQAMKLKPNKYWFELAEIHSYFKKFEDALDCVEKGLINSPNYNFGKCIKHAITDGLKFGEYYYVPIARSLLLLKLSFEDTIIYTTEIKIQTLNQNLILPAIITDKGILTYVPNTDFMTISWDKISFKSNKSFTISGFKCELHWNQRFESKKEFNTRSKIFRETINQLRKEFQ